MLYVTRAISGAMSSFSQPPRVGGSAMCRSQTSSEAVLWVHALEERWAGMLKMKGNV